MSAMTGSGFIDYCNIGSSGGVDAGDKFYLDDSDSASGAAGDFVNCITPLLPPYGASQPQNNCFAGMVGDENGCTGRSGLLYDSEDGDDEGDDEDDDEHHRSDDVIDASSSFADEQFPVVGTTSNMMFNGWNTACWNIGSADLFAATSTTMQPEDALCLPGGSSSSGPRHPLDELSASTSLDVVPSAAASSSSSSSSSARRKRKSTPTQRVAANIRERRRMCSLNAAFDRLRRRVPSFPHEKKLSRIQTLRLAIKYIFFMTELVLATSTSSSPDRSLLQSHSGLQVSSPFVGTADTSPCSSSIGYHQTPAGILMTVGSGMPSMNMWHPYDVIAGQASLDGGAAHVSYAHEFF